ncbi:hypothetical protein [Micromonospora lutea]|uniref:Uncharacterized protein n=1 Tax=Micromonospora lutea TaxID=419825 RepID=A0ABQ4IXN9_9ACTN|nr:hypothetical protein [Micromonospora lutea]GIJ22692.1 hypothetical protein Vlu01_33160 [Micromonospora lutea]
MVVRFLAQLRPLVVVAGQLFTWLLLVVDARREWSPSWFVGLLLLLGALAAIPAAVVGEPEFRLIALVTYAIGAGIVALALYDTADKRALWVYALTALGAVALPTSRPAIGRATVTGVAVALLLTIGVSAPALAWSGGSPEVTVCVASEEALDELVREGRRFDPRHAIAGFGLTESGPPCFEVLFDPGATAGDADDVARRYSVDPMVVSVSRTR